MRGGQGGWQCPQWLPFGLCPRLWDEAHVPGAEEDDIAIYGEALARRKHWPLWMLLVRQHRQARLWGLLSVAAGPAVADIFCYFISLQKFVQYHSLSCARPVHV